MRRVFLAALILLIVIGVPVALRILVQLKARQTRLQCRQCQGPIVKIRRQPWDRQISWLLPVRRYRCMDPRCRWQGLFVVAWGEKSHGLSHVPQVLIAPSELVDPTQRWISQMQASQLSEEPSDPSLAQKVAKVAVAASLILGFDPGRDKCGVVLTQGRNQRLWREIMPADQALSRLQQVRTQTPFELIVLGNQTTAREWRIRLEQAFPTCPVVLVDERNSTLEARHRYWDDHPAQGWNRILPRGLRVPPQPYDDIVAEILVERYLQGEA